MGLRIHKALGWGLTDLQACGGDSRVNWGADPFKYEGRTGFDYLPWLVARHENDKPYFSYDWVVLSSSDGLEKFGKKNVFKAVTYSPEYGKPEVLVIRPFTLTDWSRSDDSIDYAGEMLTHPGAEDWWQPVRGSGLHPFEGLFMDAETGENLPHSVIQWVRLVNGLAERLVPEEDAMSGLNALALSQTPYATHEEAKARIVPRVPEEVRDVAEFLELFTDGTVWRQLRPLLYTYWA